MNIEANINDEAKLEQAESELSGEQLSAVHGGAFLPSINTVKLTANRVSLVTDIAQLNRVGVLRDLSALRIVSNKEWQE